MNNRKIIGVSLIVGSLIMIGVIIYVIFFYRFGNQTTTTPGGDNNAPAEVLPPAKLNTNVTSTVETTGSPTADLTRTKSDEYEVSVGTVAKNFVERYGTWSNQSANEYLAGLNLISTEKMQTWLASRAKELTDNRGDYKKYYITTAQVTGVNEVSTEEAAGKSTMLVDVKYTEEKQGEETKITNRQMKVELIKVASRWKVDFAAWK